MYVEAERVARLILGGGGAHRCLSPKPGALQGK
jgi:hypothetical protein